VKEDDFDPDAHYETKVKTGDVWLLGEHRLMCGDSTKAEDVARLMNGERADIAFTSPPYNAGTSEELTGNTHTTTSKYQNSDDNLSNYDELLFKSTQNNIDFAKYAFINIQMLAGNKIVFCDFVEKFKNQLCDIAIWNKNNAQPAMARRVMNSQFEFIFIFSKDNPSRAVGTRDFRGDVPNVNNMNAQYKNEYSAIHAATFSVEFAGYYVGNFSNQGDIVLDTFGGTGTTMIACEQLNRKCRMMELDPHYCDVIIARWEKLTGKKAVKLEG
jgi:site-specific DNA-methyltransferase (adenine-specific)